MPHSLCFETEIEFDVELELISCPVPAKVLAVGLDEGRDFSRNASLTLLRNRNRIRCGDGVDIVPGTRDCKVTGSRTGGRSRAMADSAHRAGYLSPKIYIIPVVEIYLSATRRKSKSRFGGWQKWLAPHPSRRFRALKLACRRRLPVNTGSFAVG
jgi:hypothetical protein